MTEQLEQDDVKLILLGDYIHGGADNRGVLDKIMALQYRYGSDKVVALMGNHEEFVLLGDSDIDHLFRTFGEDDNGDSDGEDIGDRNGRNN